MATFSVAPACPQGVEVLREQGVPCLLARVLVARGITTWELAKTLIEPFSLESHNPFLLEDMELATQRIHKALTEGELIAVFGDYDVDGITATSLLTKGLMELGGRVISYIPKRFGEGYGLNNGALDHLKAQGVAVVVTVDCGISGFGQVEHGNSLGLDMIITDHHSCPEKLPPALAVVNPRREDNRYPFSKLAGVGVALKLVQALSPPEMWDAIIEEYCDLVAVGTVADVMPLLEENRYLVARGLKKLNQNPLLGFEKLLKETAREKVVTASTIGFSVAPRVNAAGRLDCTQVALELLLTQNEEKGTKLAQELCQLNIERQGIEGKILEECLSILEKNPPNSVVFLWKADWHPGVLGIVASRLAERYHRPAFILCSREGVGKGSCRSYGGINLYEVLTQCSPALIGFGGHAQAAGFTAEEDKLEQLEAALVEAVDSIPETDATRGASAISVDLTVAISDLSLEEIQGLEGLEPCGAECSRPVFRIEGAEIRQATMVADGKHLKLRLWQQGAEIEGIYFHYKGEPIYIGQMVNVACYPRINHFRGIDSPQIQVFHVQPQVTAGEKLIEKLTKKEVFTPEEATSLLPVRATFVFVWKWLQKRNAQENLAQLCSGLESLTQLPPQQGQVCLAVFLEGDLITLTAGRQLEFPAQREKMDLEQTPIMQHLRSCL